MRDVIEKKRQAVVVWLIALGVLWPLWPPALGFARLWAVVVASVLMNVLQPAYTLMVRAGGPEDRGTFIRNVGSV